jgi:parallel beta-helix repeat protein
MVTLGNRFNTLLLLILVLMAGAIITMLATRAYGGPLDPPGPPSATGTLPQVEPRMPIPPVGWNGSFPIAITQPGSYFLTRSLTGTTGQNGITISSSDVTLDLSGFTLTGVPGSVTGIETTAALNVTIRNGAVRAWAYGIRTGGLSRVDGVQSSSNGDIGIWVSGGSVVSNCNASLNPSFGVYSEASIVRDCIALGNGRGIEARDGSLVESNRANGNDRGISIVGDKNMILGNQMAGNVFEDVQIAEGSVFNVLMDNVYCTAVGLVPPNVEAGNLC